MNVSCTMRRTLLILVAVVLLSGTSHAQIPVHDSSVTIRNAITAALKDEQIQSSMRNLGVEPAPSTTEAFEAYIAAETQKWAKVIRQAGIKIN